MNIEEFKIKSVRIDNTNENFPEADAWKVTVTNPRGRTLTHNFYKGHGHRGAEPEIMEFMNSLVSDAAFGENYESAEEFGHELGYEMDDPKDRSRAKSIYNACVKLGPRIASFLTDEEREYFEDY